MALKPTLDQCNQNHQGSCTTNPILKAKNSIIKKRKKGLVQIFVNAEVRSWIIWNQHFDIKPRNIILPLKSTWIAPQYLPRFAVCFLILKAYAGLEDRITSQYPTFRLRYSISLRYKDWSNRLDPESFRVCCCEDTSFWARLNA